MSTLFPEFNDGMTERGAVFSECGRYRFKLWRIWDRSRPLVMVIGLNPSTANAETDDATIRVLGNYAERWGFGGFFMLNLFPFISTDPKGLEFTGMDENRQHLLEVSCECSVVVFAWGAFKVAREQSAVVSAMFPDAMAMRVNADGSPHHPLYLPADLQLVNYSRPCN